MQKITTFLMFEGQAEEAMNFYLSLFPQSELISITRYGEDVIGGVEGAEGTVEQARFTLNGQPFICTDSSVKHDFTFTPSISLYVTCKTEAEIDTLFEKLSADGQIMMPLAPYPFSPKYGWLADRFGVCWQLILEPAE